MNFNPKNITKDAFLTFVGVFLASLCTLVTLFLASKNRITFEQAGKFLAMVLPILLGFFGLAGRNNKNFDEVHQQK